MTDSYESRGIKRGPAKVARIVLYSILLVALFVFVLPFTQHLMDVQERRTVRSIDVALPPPPPPPPEPPPPQEEQVEQPKPELQSQPKPLSLSQLQLAMNPGTGNALGAAFGMGSFDVDTDALSDIQTFSVAELDEVPKLIRQPAWTWPRHAVGRVKSDVTAYAFIEITEKGNVEFQRFRNISNEIIREDLVEHIEGFRFTKPTKDGKPARARFALPIELPRP